MINYLVLSLRFVLFVQKFLLLEYHSLHCYYKLHSYVLFQKTERSNYSFRISTYYVSKPFFPISVAIFGTLSRYFSANSQIHVELETSKATSSSVP